MELVLTRDQEREALDLALEIGEDPMVVALELFAAGLPVTRVTVL